MNHVYVVGQICTNDSKHWTGYCSQVLITLESWDASRKKKKHLCQGNKTVILAIKSPALSNTNAWHNTEAHQTSALFKKH